MKEQDRPHHDVDSIIADNLPMIDGERSTGLEYSS